MSDNLETAERIARALAKELDAKMPRGWGFTLLLAKFNAAPSEPSVTYISNCVRKDMRDTMRELLEKWDRDDMGDRAIPRN